MQFSNEVQAALAKIKEKFGFKVTAEGLVSCTTGQKVRRTADIEKASLVLESMADTSIEQIAGMMRREQRDADGEAVVVPQTLIPVLDGRLARPEANKLDRDLFHSLRVPYAEDREARTIAREEGCLVYVEGHKATRVASECLRVALPREIVEEIDTKASAYREQANAALIRIAAECTRGGEPAHVHQRLAESMGRDAVGVRGITLTGDDYVIGAEKAEDDTTLLTVTENGFGKRTELVEYLRTGPGGEKIAQSRGGKGLKNYNITPKTGKVAGCRVVKDTDDVMLIENGGVIIRVPANSINIYKRDVQGVIIMRIEEGNKLVSVERVEAVEEETQA